MHAIQRPGCGLASPQCHPPDTQALETRLGGSSHLILRGLRSRRRADLHVAVGVVLKSSCVILEDAFLRKPELNGTPAAHTTLLALAQERLILCGATCIACHPAAQVGGKK